VWPTPAELSALGGLFASAFVSATILPMQSEIVLAMLLAADALPAWLLVAVASVGNTLGAIVNWLLGRFITEIGHNRWFPASGAALERAEGHYRRWGRWSLLLSWAPIIGDPLTVLAGVLREPLVTFVPIVALAKTGRYVLVALLAGV
jgi:membrane protein YqaA with SNARE-associated domain